MTLDAERGSRRWLYADAWSPRDRRLLLQMSAVSVLIGVGSYIWPDYVPLAFFAVPLVAASLLMRPTQMPWLVAVTLVCLGFAAIEQPHEEWRDLLRIAAILAVAAVALIGSERRSRLGVSGTRASDMLLELRDRVQRQGGIPVLPPDWEMQQAIRSAGSSAFAGDFVVATRRGGVDHLEYCLVDVSGKGEAAGVRALQLTGALGGILGSLPPADFLSAANEWVLEQEWDEGFATAVHVSLDLATGGIEIRSAGHPPAMVRGAGSGRWTILQAEGPALGLLPDADYGSVEGELRRGDLLMVCTDGVIETSKRDSSMGIDRLTGVAEGVLREGLENSASRLMEAVSQRGDDRALVMLRRL